MRGFDVTPIVSNFYNGIYSSRRHSNSDAYIILIVPSILAQIAIIRQIEPIFLTVLGTALSILFGFTFQSLLTVANYSPSENVNEEIVVRETRTGTSYGLLVNFSALTAIILVTIVISDFSTMPYTLSVIISAFIYYLVFHYLIVMVYLMRRLFLLTVGGAFEDGSETNMDDQESENRTTIKRA